MQKTMLYTNLGRTGLKVSRISFGNWLNSDKPEAQEEMVKMVQKAWELGINFFDTAEIYGAGEAERQFGVALKNLNVPRDQYVLSTKLFGGPNKENDPNDQGLSRKHIIQGLKASLSRLQQDYVDIVFAHRFDSETPLEETCRAFDWVVNQGLAHYWATSEWEASQIMEAFLICEKYNLVPPIADQCQYNMLERRLVDKEYARLFDLYGYGTTVWSPLAGGLLTGKYNDGIPEKSRVDSFKQFYQDKIQNFEQLQKKLQGLGKIAEKVGISQAQLALAWVLKSNDVSTAIVGASKVSQLEDSVQAAQHLDKLTPEILNEIEEILETRPQPAMNWRQWKPFVNRR